MMIHTHVSFAAVSLNVATDTSFLGRGEGEEDTAVDSGFSLTALNPRNDV